MPNSPLGRPAAQIDADVQARLDLLPAVARCAFCPDWAYEGTALECRQAAAQHRAEAHPTLKASKRRRVSLSRFNLGLESDRLAGEANAASVARMLASRQVA